LSGGRNRSKCVLPDDTPKEKPAEAGLKGSAEFLLWRFSGIRFCVRRRLAVAIQNSTFELCLVIPGGRIACAKSFHKRADAHPQYLGTEVILVELVGRSPTSYPGGQGPAEIRPTSPCRGAFIAHRANLPASIVAQVDVCRAARSILVVRLITEIRGESADAKHAPIFFRAASGWRS
jgi:hypothetical protein